MQSPATGYAVVVRAYEGELVPREWREDDRISVQRRCMDNGHVGGRGHSLELTHPPTVMVVGFKSVCFVKVSGEGDEEGVEEEDVEEEG